jgi:dihydroorotate dehydrogenase
MSTEMIAFLRRNLPARVPIVGVGGIFDGRDAFEKICHGAACIQIYTGFVYGGPTTVSRINRELDALLADNGFAHVADAVGAKL